MDIPGFIYPFVSWSIQHLSCFHFGATINNAHYEHLCAPICVDICLHFSWVDT